MKKQLITSTLERTGLRWLLQQIVPWSGMLVLNYHRVGNGQETPFDHGLWSAQADSFECQMRFLKSHTDVISPSEIEAVSRKQRAKYAIVTFDDGYRDNYEVAYPILRNLGLPATFFIATGFIDNPRVPWWDELAWMVRTSGKSVLNFPHWINHPVLMDEPLREKAVRTLLRVYKRLSAEQTSVFLEAVSEESGTGRCPPEEGRKFWMDWDMIREMQKGGMTIGGHTVNHPVLSSLSEIQQRREIEECAERLRQETGEPMKGFSYPVGGPDSYNVVTIDILRRIGVRTVYTYFGGFTRLPPSHYYEIPRIPVEMCVTMDWFRSVVTLPWLCAKW